MDYAPSPIETAIRPWRTATLVAMGIAAVELVLLVIVGAALFADPGDATSAKRGAAKERTTTSAAVERAKLQPKPTAAAAQLPRGKVPLLVLNGNGVTGAAATIAARARDRGYPIRAVGNAPRADYTRSLVMYRRGFAGEAARLARDLGVRIVAPLDGIRGGQLQGAKVVLVVGS